MISFWDIFFILLNMEFSCNVLETMLKLLAVCFLEWINYLKLQNSSMDGLTENLWK